MEIIVLLLFCASLITCIAADISILLALIFGLILFWTYGFIKGFTAINLLRMSLSGINTVKNILITFLLIGIMTALWRDAGTIAVIVSLASKLITPSVFILAVFLLNCFVSVLTGTAFGTAATMGVICASMAGALGVNPVFTGGAVLAGAYFGDRCSPISTSAILVSTLTKTNLFTNIKNMIKTAAVPFVLSCICYGVLGVVYMQNGDIPNLSEIFVREFDMSIICVLPAITILVLSLLKVNVKIAMGASILCAIPISIFLQGTDISSLLRLSVLGFSASDSLVAPMMNGGGIVSMLKAVCIVCLSSSYSDIFRKTGLLDKAKGTVTSIAHKTTPYAAFLITSVVSSMIACNQTLSIMLTHQLCSDTDETPSRFAINLEDTAVIVAPLVPWSIACTVALSSVDCPQESIVFAFFLYLLPICRLITSKTNLFIIK